MLICSYSYMFLFIDLCSIQVISFFYRYNLSRLQLSRFIGIRKPETTQSASSKGNRSKTCKNKNSLFVLGRWPNEFNYDDKTLSGLFSNESDENVYKHKDLFTKAQVKINKLREWYIQNVYYEQAAALEKVY